MGITFIKSDETQIHSDDLDFAITTKTKPYLPAMRSTRTVIPGMDGAVVHEDAYDPIVIELDCNLGGYDIGERRRAVRTISSVLSKVVAVIFDYESGKRYNVIESINDVKATFKHPIENFKMELVCTPYQEDIYSSDRIMLGELHVTWGEAHILWGGPTTRSFIVTNGSVMTLINNGTYESKPIITLTGVASSVSFGGMTFTGLNGTVIIDCRDKHKVVYSMSGSTVVNRIGTFTGDFIEIAPGDTDYTVTGTITNLTISFDYKDTYL